MASSVRSQLAASGPCSPVSRSMQAKRSRRIACWTTSGVTTQPDSGVRAVAYQVSKLRSLLEPDRTDEGSLITTTSAGYVLDLESAHVDVNEFDRLVDLARDALPRDPAACQALLEQALRALARSSVR